MSAWEAHPCGCGRTFISRDALAKHECSRNPLHSPEPLALPTSPDWQGGGQHAPHVRAPFALGDKLSMSGEDSPPNEVLECIAITHGFAIWVAYDGGEPSVCAFDSYYGWPVDDDAFAAELIADAFMDKPRRAWCWQTLAFRDDLWFKMQIVAELKQSVADGVFTREFRDGEWWYGLVEKPLLPDAEFWATITRAYKGGERWNDLYDRLPEARRRYKNWGSLCTRYHELRRSGKL